MNLLLENVSKSFDAVGTKIQVLEQVHLQIHSGESVAITGPSGTGKTSLLSILSGLEKVDEGSLLYDQQQMRDLSDSEWRRFRSVNLGIVFQSFYLLPQLTALENVMFAAELIGVDRHEASSRAARLLEQCGLAERMNQYPAKLSGGEQQRVCIARSLVHQPKIILADEPTGNLDNKTGTKVAELFFELCHKHHTSIVLVTHDLDLARKCQRVFELNNGKLQDISA